VPFKFENLEVWQLALVYQDAIYDIAKQLPRSEEYNLKSQISRAATPVALNIAEGSTGQTNNEQARFIGLAIRSLLETVVYDQHLIARRKYIPDQTSLKRAYGQAETLAAKLHTLRKVIAPDQNWLREASTPYRVEISEDLDHTDGE
jgi:four helix bundle protein